MEAAERIEAFSSKVNKAEIPVYPILGVNIAAINMEWLLKFLRENIKGPQGNRLTGDYICVSNVHTTVTSYDNPEYARIQNSGVMALPDGGPLSSLGRKRGFSEMQRVTGPGLMEEIFKVSVQEGYKHYFYGSTRETLDKLIKKLEAMYPGIKIAGSYSPPFIPMTKEEEEAAVKMINLAAADFIWVGLGAPKQEIWMARQQGKINGLMIGVGAGFDYCAGNIKRAPQWMQANNLEWLYRLLQDPKRLFKRYLVTNIKFIWLALIRGK